MQHWLQHLATQRRYSDHTITAYRQDLQHLLRGCPHVPLAELGEHHIRLALSRLHAQAMQPRSLARILAAWRSFFAWWGPQAGLGSNPASGIRAPRIARPLPKALSVEQAQALLDRPGLPAPDSAVDKRDHAMFELLYSSGLRVSELVSLDIRAFNIRALHAPGYQSSAWLQLDEGLVTVKGKGGKTRSVPVGRQAVQAIRIWLAVRPALLPAAVQGLDIADAGQADTPHDLAVLDTCAALFLGVRGRRITRRVVQAQLSRWAAKVGLPVHVHPHSLRHSFASHVLQSSHDLRAVQEMLGHANISSTQIYTRLDYQHLAHTYDQAHPRAQRKPQGN